MQMTVWLNKLGRKVPATVAAGLALVFGTVILSTTSIQTNSEKDVAVGNSVNLSSKLTELCSANDDTAKVLHSAKTPDGKGLCDTANAVLAHPTVQAAAVMTDDHVVTLVRQELAKQPPPTNVAPSLPQVMDAVRAVAAANPLLFKGEKGDTPSSSEISSIVLAYVKANPDQFRGEAGRDANTASMDGRLAQLQREVDQLKSRGATTDRDRDRGTSDPRTRQPDPRPRDPRPPVTRTHEPPTRTEDPPTQPPRDQGPPDSTPGMISIN